LAVARKLGQDPKSIPHGTEWGSDEVEVATLRAQHIRHILQMDITVSATSEII